MLYQLTFIPKFGLLIQIARTPGKIFRTISNCRIRLRKKQRYFPGFSYFFTIIQTIFNIKFQNDFFFQGRGAVKMTRAGPFNRNILKGLRYSPIHAETYNSIRFIYCTYMFHGILKHVWYWQRIIEILPLKKRFVSRNFSIDTTDVTVSDLIFRVLYQCSI